MYFLISSINSVITLNILTIYTQAGVDSTPVVLEAVVCATAELYCILQRCVVFFSLN